MRAVAFVGLVLLVSGCQNPLYRERLATILKAKADMPDCMVGEVEPFERFPGGGVDGNGYAWDFSGNLDCRVAWAAKLEKSSKFDCHNHAHGYVCSSGEIGRNETVTVHVVDGGVARVIWVADWSKI